MTATYSRSWEGALFALAEQASRPAIPRTPLPLAVDLLLEQGYARCDAVISEHGKTFYLASRLLPPDKRRAIRALYAFCRVADNTVDCPYTDPSEKAAKLAE